LDGIWRGPVNSREVKVQQQRFDGSGVGTVRRNAGGGTSQDGGGRRSGPKKKIANEDMAGKKFAPNKKNTGESCPENTSGQVFTKTRARTKNWERKGGASKQPAKRKPPLKIKTGKEKQYRHGAEGPRKDHPKPLSHLHERRRQLAGKIESMRERGRRKRPKADEGKMVTA